MGGIEKNIIAQAKRFKNKLPERIQNRPVLAWWLAFYYDAFIMLDADRTVGFDISLIPWSTLHAYAIAHGLEGDDYHDFIYLVRYMDLAYIKHRASKDATSGKSG